MSANILVSGQDPAGLLAAALAARPLAEQLGAAVEALVLSAPGDGAPASPAMEETAVRLAGLVEGLVVADLPAGVPATGAALADALVSRARSTGTALVLLADSPASREAAARVAVRLEGSCVSMCESLELSEGRVRVTRPIYGGAAVGTLTLKAGPAVCVISVDRRPEWEPSGAAPEVTQLALVAGDLSPTYTVVAEEPVVRSCNLEGARVIVSVGRGFAKAADIPLIDGLVDILGAEVGCSRPIAEDFKWLPKERLVGLTGSTVTPDLYLAVGISGQVQHLAGIKGARVVAAINSDARSPIIRNADYSIVGDLYKVVPALTEALTRSRNGG